jgi:hypothetical protein
VKSTTTYSEQKNGNGKISVYHIWKWDDEEIKSDRNRATKNLDFGVLSLLNYVNGNLISAVLKDKVATLAFDPS